MRIVLRFLKETGLLPLWKEYFYLEVKIGKRFTKEHWSNVRHVDDVLGNTNFTKFVAYRLSKRDGVTYDRGIPIYQRFAYWLQKWDLMGIVYIQIRGNTFTIEPMKKCLGIS